MFGLIRKFGGKVGDNNLPGVIQTGSGVEEHRRRFEIDYFDKDNPRSIFSLTPEYFQEKLQDEELLKYVTEDEVHLRTICRPTPTVSRLRLSFWYEYDKCQNVMRKEMNMPNVYSGICSKVEFFRNILGKPKNLAWLLKPPIDYVRSMEEALHLGVDRLRDILDFPLYNVKGDPNPKIAEVILKVVAMLDQRVKGALVQKVSIDQRTSSVNVQVQARDTDEDLESLGKRLKEVQGEAKQLGIVEVGLNSDTLAEVEFLTDEETKRKTDERRARARDKARTARKRREEEAAAAGADRDSGEEEGNNSGTPS